MNFYGDSKTWIQRQKRRPFTSPPSLKFAIPNQREAGAVQSSSEDGQNKSVFPEPYS